MQPNPQPQKLPLLLTPQSQSPYHRREQEVQGKAKTSKQQKDLPLTLTIPHPLKRPEAVEAGEAAHPHPVVVAAVVERRHFRFASPLDCLCTLPAADAVVAVVAVAVVLATYCHNFKTQGQPAFSPPQSYTTATNLQSTSPAQTGKCSRSSSNVQSAKQQSKAN